MNDLDLVVKTLTSMQETMQNWWQNLGFSEFSIETAAIAQSSKGFFKTQFKFNVDSERKCDFLTEGNGGYDVFIVDNLQNRNLFVQKLKERFPTAVLFSYESFPICDSHNFRISSVEAKIYFQDF